MLKLNWQSELSMQILPQRSGSPSPLLAFIRVHWNMRGFYWATEEIGWSATFTSSSANNFGNPHVMLMDAMSDLVKGSYGKEFLWMPYMEMIPGVGLDKNDVRVGYVANRSTIFLAAWLLFPWK